MRWETIVVGFDDTDDSIRALGRAIVLAKTMDATADRLERRPVLPSGAAAHGVGPFDPADPPQEHRAALERIREAVEGEDVEVEFDLEAGDPRRHADRAREEPRRAADRRRDAGAGIHRSPAERQRQPGRRPALTLRRPDRPLRHSTCFGAGPARLRNQDERAADRRLNEALRAPRWPARAGTSRPRS